MLRNGFAGMREGDLFHGRYRIRRHVEDDLTSAMYEATDTITKTQHVIKLIRPDAIVGAGRRILFKGDTPGSDKGDVAYLSNAGLDLATKSLFVMMEVEEDDDANAVTQIHDGGVRHAPLPLSIADASPIIRSSLPLPLPPPLPHCEAGSSPDPALRSPQADPPPCRGSLLSLATFGPLPPPTPPPMADGPPVGGGSLPGSETFGPLPHATPEPLQISTMPTDAQQRKRVRMQTAQRLVVFVVVAIVVGSIVYFQLNRSEKEPTTSEENTATTTPPGLPTPSAQPAAAAGANADPQPAETASPNREEIPPMTAPPNAQKSSTDQGARTTTKRRRETLY